MRLKGVGMSVKRVLSYLLVLVLLSAPWGHLALGHAPLRIDPVFLQEVQHSPSWIAIVVEFQDLPGVEFWHQQQLQQQLQQKQQTQPTPSSPTPQSSLLAFTVDYQQYLLSKQDHFLAWVSRKKLSLIPKHHLTLTLNAITAEIKGTDIMTLSLCPHVYKIHDARQSFEPIRHLASKSSGTDLVWTGIEDSTIPPLSGKNMLIGIMDTGIDTQHPEFAQEGKIKGGYNIADNNEDIKDDGSHGTLVAGIAAGLGSKDEKQGRGMAYDASIMVYKIFSNKSNAPADVLGAMERAVKDRCDVLNCSFGGSSSDHSTGDSAFHRAVRNVDKAGTLVVAGAGNSGSRRKEVPWPILMPSIVDTAFSVGGTDDRKETPFLTVDVNEGITRTLQAIQTPHSQRMTSTLFHNGVIDAGYGLKEELSKLDLAQKVALIQRGPQKDSLSFRDKAENALQAGAIGVIFYNNVPHQNTSFSLLRPGEDKSQIQHLPPSISLSKEDGEYVKRALNKQSTFQIDYKQYSTIANFSSMGLSGDSAFKPEITAPSTQIVSTVSGGKYGNSSGTSFSTPMISGMTTLLKEARPDWNHQQIKSAFMNTADLMINPVNQLPISFTLQGAGSARLDKALQTPAFIEPRALVLSPIPDSVTHTFSVTNASDQTQVFPLSAEFFHLNHETLPLTLSFDKSELKLEKGQQASFSIEIISNKPAFLQNRYEGIIKLGDELHIPLICYRDPAPQVEESVSNIRLSQDHLDLSQPNALALSPLQISFSLNAGEITSRVTKDYTSYTSFNYGTVNLFVADDSGEEWGKIHTFHNLMVGEYTFLWDGTNENNELFLPKGAFYLYFTINLREQKGQDWTTKAYGPFKKAFQVIASGIPPLPTANLSALKMYHGDETVRLGLRFNELPPQVLSEEEITKIEFHLHYGPPQQVLFQKAEPQGFLSKEGLVEFEMEDDKEGVLKIAIHTTGLSPAMVNELPFLMLDFLVLKSGELSFYTRSFVIHTASQNTYRVKAYEVKSRSSNRAFLLGDLNKDKVVDRHDFELFIASFGSKAGEANYDEKSDFNQDMRIDLFDLGILSREMGKSI
jgi:subtilisin family serine protease